MLFMYIVNSTTMHYLCCSYIGKQSFFILFILMQKWKI